MGVEDYGWTLGGLVSRTIQPTRPRGHAAFWTGWKSRLADAPTEIRPARAIDLDPADPTATHILEGLGHTRIGCVLLLPPSGVSVRGGVVASHGYERPIALAEEARDWKKLTERGTAVLVIRVRGYAGSQLDVGDLSSDGRWILQGLGSYPEPASSPTDWVLSAAVADLVLAVRGLRGLLERMHGAELPVGLHGESFGAGLAVVAASQLADLDPIDRLCIGLPTFGDWSFRAQHAHHGSGELVRRFLMTLGEAENDVSMLVHSFDAALHARRILCPVLAKLALRDEVVPAPTQHAVFNSLRTSSGERWRFLVDTGHEDAGLADARRHALFERALIDFFDYSGPATRFMQPWEGVLSGGELRKPRNEGLFGEEPGNLSEHDALLIAAYSRTGRTLDDLPYTSEFDEVLALVREQCPAFGAREVFHRLQNLRKAGKLPRTGSSVGRPPTIEEDESIVLAELVVQHAGTMGQRDRLPYSVAFEKVVAAFNEQTGRELSPHSVWRIVAKLAK